MKVVLLGGARVFYLAAMGVAFFIAAALAQPRELGIYALASSYAALVVVTLTFGLDRLLFIQVTKVPTARVGPAIIVPRLFGMVVVAVALVASGLRPEVVAASAVVATRVWLNDVEAVALGRRKTHAVSAATLANAAVTAPLTILAAPSGATWLLGASAAGNLVAACSLSISARTSSDSDVTTIRLRDAWPFAAISLVGVLYLRGGMSLLPLRGLGPAEIASFAVAFKAFEFLVAARGALVQHLAAGLISGSGQSTRRVLGLVTLTGLACGVVGLTASRQLQQARVLEQYVDVWVLVGLVAACAPLIMSHAATSAFVYSRPGTTVLLKDSSALAVLALAGIGVAAGFDIAAVVVVTCVMEYVSFAAFGWRFRAEGFQWDVWNVLMPAAACAPLFGLSTLL